MRNQKSPFPTIIGIIIVVLLSILFYRNDFSQLATFYNHDKTDIPEDENSLKIIDKIFSENGKNISGAVVLWSKGDVPFINQLYTNYPLDGIPCDIASKNDKLSEKYYLIMDLIKEIPNLDKLEIKNLNISDYYIFGANIDWENKKDSKVIQRVYKVRLFVDRNNNIYLPEIYPYHDNNSNNIVGNRFMAFQANEKAKELIEQILEDVS